MMLDLTKRRKNIEVLVLASCFLYRSTTSPVFADVWWQATGRQPEDRSSQRCKMWIGCCTSCSIPSISFVGGYNSSKIAQFLKVLWENQLLWGKIAVPSMPPLVRLEFAFMILNTMGAVALEFPWMCKALHTLYLYVVCIFICLIALIVLHWSQSKGSICEVCSFHHRPLTVLKLGQKLIH